MADMKIIKQSVCHNDSVVVSYYDSETGETFHDNVTGIAAWYVMEIRKQLTQTQQALDRAVEALEKIAKGGEIIGKTEVALLYDCKSVTIAREVLKLIKE